MPSFQRNQITRRSGCHTPREQYTAPRRSLHSCLNGYLNFPNITSSRLLIVPGFLYISPEHCDLVNDVTHISASATQSEITHELTIMMLYYRQNQCCGYEKPKKLLRAFTAAPSVLERTQCRSSRILGHHCLYCQKPSPLRSRPPKLVWRLRAAKYLL